MGDQETFFSFTLQPFTFPSYRYTGGTQCLSEIHGLNLEERLKYIHKHSHFKIKERSSWSKDGDKGKDLWKQGKENGGIQGILSLNEAITQLTEADWELVHEDIRSILNCANLEKLFKPKPEVSENISSKIEVQFSKEKGRYVVAKEDIEVGETILRESPFISILHSSHRYSNCATCLRYVVYGVGCSKCNQVLFCSALCKEQGLEFHSSECSMLDILPPCGTIAPVLRIFTKYGLSFFKDKEELLEIQPTPVKAFPTLHRNNPTQFINNSSQKNSNLCKSNSSQENCLPSQENSTLCQKNSDSTHNNSNSTENNSNLPKNNSKSRQNNSKSSQNNSNSTGNNCKSRQNNSNSPHNNSKLPRNNSDSTQNNSNSLKNKYNSNSRPNNSNSAEPSLSELSTTKHLEDLCTLQAGNKIDSMYMMEKSAWTYYILFLLRQLKFFNNSDQLGEDEILIGRFIELFLKISDNNCHEISELDAGDIEEISFSSLQEREDLNRIVGVGIYLCSSFFNNSCDVNTMKYHDGRTEVMQAKRKIRAGEEVADFYGEYFFLTDKYSRRRNFGFSCSCKACKEGWPLLDELEVFTPEQLQNRLDWVVNRVELEDAAQKFDVLRTKTICERLSELGNVSSPHESIIVPEMYLHFTNLLLHNNKSLRFEAWASKHINL